MVYREVRTSLLSESDLTFHLKNKGITIIAQQVKATQGKPVQVLLGPADGIVDGGHTYRVILDGQDEGIPEKQHVKFEILVGVDEDLITPIAGGLNTGIQVQPMSLANLGGKFEWIKDLLAQTPYHHRIAYRENEKKDVDIRDVIVYMTLFNIDRYPNDKTEYPTVAYHRRAATLNDFLDDEKGKSYRKLAGILPDILTLADVVRRDAPGKHNEEGGRAGKLAFVEQRKKGEFPFPFTDKKGKSRLAAGAHIPMLGAFRWMVEEGPDGQFQWKGSFADVLALWDRVAAEMMLGTKESSDELGRRPDAIGKSRNHWQAMHTIVLREQLLQMANRT